MTTPPTDMRAPNKPMREELAEIRHRAASQAFSSAAATPADFATAAADRRALLSHIDWQAAEIARMREALLGIQQFAFERDIRTITQMARRAIAPSTETGEKP